MSLLSLLHSRDVAEELLTWTRSTDLSDKPLSLLRLFHECFEVNVWVWRSEEGTEDFCVEKDFSFYNGGFDETWMFLFERPTRPGTLYHVLPLMDNRPDDAFDMQISYKVKRKRPMSVDDVN